MAAPPRLSAADLASLADPRVDPPAFLTAVAAHGPVVAYRQGDEERVLLREPADVHEVLTRWPEECRSTPITRTAAAIIGDGLITSGAPNWRPRRLAVQRELTYRAVRRYAGTFAEVANEHAAAWSAAGSVDLRDDVGGITLENLGRTVFGADFTAYREVLVASLATSHTAIDAVLRGAFGDEHRAALARAAADLDALVQGLVARQAVAPVAGADLLATMVECAASGDPAFRDPWLRDETITLVMAGHETTAFTVTAALHLLARHPDVAGRLRADLEAASAEGVADGALADEVPLARHVVEEALRLYPPLSALHRTATADTEIGGYRVPAGTIVVVSPWVVQHDARWWPDPETFDPWRFAGERRRALPKHAFLPFAAGARVCAGNHYALLEAAVVVAVLTLRLRLADDAAAVLPRVVDSGTALRLADPFRVAVRSAA